MGFDAAFAIIGHRGAAGLAPENTLESFQTAFDHDVDAIELDVHAVEEHLLVIHDAELDRTTNGKGQITGHTFAALRALDAGAGHAIPTLVEVLAMTPLSVGVNVELKGPQTAAMVAELVSRSPHEFLISSFDHAELRRYRAIDPDTRCAPLIRKLEPAVLAVARDLGAWSVNVSNRAVKRQHIEEIADSGYKVLVYTVNDAARARELRRWGAAGVFTDYPDRVTR